ncbi:hypothetical protein C8F01DRAFT_1105710 [Mycena amicta]|nr:hypothetical protein C8F01DRAFT_1105710 [Mycena amicta]
MSSSPLMMTSSPKQMSTPSSGYDPNAENVDPNLRFKQSGPPSRVMNILRDSLAHPVHPRDAEYYDYSSNRAHDNAHALRSSSLFADPIGPGSQNLQFATTTMAAAATDSYALNSRAPLPNFQPSMSVSSQPQRGANFQPTIQHQIPFDRRSNHSSVHSHRPSPTLNLYDHLSPNVPQEFEFPAHDPLSQQIFEELQGFQNQQQIPQAQAFYNQDAYGPTPLQAPFQLQQRRQHRDPHEYAYYEGYGPQVNVNIQQNSSSAAHMHPYSHLVNNQYGQPMPVATGIYTDKDQMYQQGSSSKTLMVPANPSSSDGYGYGTMPSSGALDHYANRNAAMSRNGNGFDWSGRTGLGLKLESLETTTALAHPQPQPRLREDITRPLSPSYLVALTEPYLMEWIDHIPDYLPVSEAERASAREVGMIDYSGSWR